MAPNTPQTAVGWNPRAWKASPAAIPRRVTISLPATIAATTKSAPDAPWACACASAAATTATLTWAIDPVCVSS